MLLANGCWAEFRRGAGGASAPCLFLDRDGVVVEEVNYLQRRQDVALIGCAAAVVRRANRLGWLCGLVTNQSGIGRGYYGWSEFEEVQAELETGLAAHGARFDFVLACPYHPRASTEAYRHPRHPWRKPEPGMLEAVKARLDPHLERSIVVGDTLADLQAGTSAGVGRLYHVATGHGCRERAAVAQWQGGRKVECLDSIAGLLTVLEGEQACWDGGP